MESQPEQFEIIATRAESRAQGGSLSSRFDTNRHTCEVRIFIKKTIYINLQKKKYKSTITTTKKPIRRIIKTLWRKTARI
jgi:hypothetical protein